MTLTIIGAGYVGLVTAAVFSDLGNKVFCVDIDQKKVADLKRGIIPFYEPQLAEYIERNVKKKQLSFTTRYEESVPKSQIVLICVGTPSKNDGEADLSYLFSAVEETAKNIKKYTLIAIKSTIPIGFEDDLEDCAKKFAKTKFEFASAPEFLREGTAIEDTLHPDRIVVGASSQKAQKILLDLHAPIGGERIVCDTRSAQLIKYASNAFLATKISFANAIANICEKAGADVEKVLSGVGADKRIGRSFLFPGVGYGGSCLPKDVLAFIAVSNYFGYNFDILSAVHAVNDAQIEFFTRKILGAFGKKPGEDLKGKSLAILGLSFKPNTDDMRDAPSVKVIHHLQDLNAKIIAYDPEAMPNAKRVLTNVNYAKDVYGAVRTADAIVLVTEWSEFKEMDMEKVKKLLNSPIIIDGRNMFNKEKMVQLGFEYFAVGR